MNTEKSQKLILSSLFAALCCVATLIIKIPIPATGGYINLGDGFVLLSGWILGPVYGPLAAGIGSALADLIAGYFIYIPATFVIKALVALVAYLVFKLCLKFLIKYQVFARIISSVAGEAVMIAGYFLYETVLYGAGAALAGVVGNSIQAVGGIVLSVVIIGLLVSTKAIKRIV